LKRSVARSVLKKVIFSAFAVIAFFFLSELVLRLAGLPRQQAFPSPIAFQQLQTPVLSPEPQNSQIRTSVYTDNRRTFKSPKPKGAFRAFSFGGSATMGMGFPYNGSFSRWLELMFAEAYPNREMEVLNMGSVGFCSEQVKAIAREVLEKGEPDLLIIYSGNNEFLDIKARRAMREVEQRRQSRLPNRLIAASATLRAIRTLLPSMRRMDDEDRRIVNDYLGVKPDETEVRAGYERFENNLREIAREAKARHVPVIFSTVLANPFYMFPERAMLGMEMDGHPHGRDIFQAAGWCRLGRWDKAREALASLESFGRKIELVRVHEAGGVRGIDRLSESTRNELRETARAIEALPKTERRGDEDLYPLAISYRILDDGRKLKEILEEAFANLRNDPTRDIRLPRETLYAQFGGDAAFHDAFYKLWKEDPMHNWAVPEINEIIRRAAAGESVILLDLEKELPDWMDPLPSRYLLDYCHLNIEGAFETARLLFEKSRAAEFLPPSNTMDFRESLLRPSLEWLRAKAHDFTQRDRYLGLDFRVCFAYCPPHPRVDAMTEWANEDAEKFPDKEVVRMLMENRRWYGQ
jgi:hypothetical protein